jgi:ABC-2 type transport system ATP-binding protein
LKKEGKIIVISTHLMDFAEKMCDHLAMIDRGKIIMQGSLPEIKSRYARRNVNLVYEGDISFLSTLPFVEKVEDFGNSAGIQVTDPSYIQELLKSIVSSGIIVKSFRANEISLHEIFVLLAGNENLTQSKEGIYA